jgi:integrase
MVPTTRPFEELAWEWFDREKDRLKPSTRRIYETGLRLHVLPRLGRLKPHKITEDHVADLIRAMEKDGKAESTIKNALAPLGRILKWMTRRGMVSGNVISRLERSERPKPSPKKPKRILDLAEIRRLLDGATSDQYRLFLAIAINTGMRQSEVLGLLWRNIDFAKRSIIVDGQLERAGKQDEITIPPHRVDYAKSEAGHRTITLIDADLFKVLRQFRMASAFKGPGDLVFCTGDGKPLSHRNVSNRGFDRAKQNAKIDVPGKPKLKLHHLRDTYASGTIAAGIQVYDLSRQLGHTDASFTYRIYVDLFEARDKAERNRDLLAASGFTGLI